METLKVLTQYYSGYDEDSRLRSRHGMVEYLTTMRYIEKYLTPGMRVLEIGAATGRHKVVFLCVMLCMLFGAYYVWGVSYYQPSYGRNCCWRGAYSG